MPAGSADSCPNFEGRMSPRAMRAGWACLWLMAAGVYLWRLWGGSLDSWDEALSAERAREMFALNEWLTPYFAYAPSMQKPPLYYWFVMLLYQCFGIDEFAVRLPSALFALAAMGLAARIASRCACAPEAGLITFALLLTNAYWVNRTRQGMLDSTMLAGVLAVYWLILHERPSALTTIIAAGALAMAVLAKSPFALLLAFFVPVELWLRRDGQGLRRAGIVMLAVVILTGLWMGLQAHRWGADYFYTFRYEHVGQFLHGEEKPERGLFYYLPEWWSRAPVSLALVAGGIAWAAAARRRRTLLECRPYLMVLGGLLLVLSQSVSKRHLYLVWLFPWGAIIAGVALARIHLAVRPGWKSAALAAAWLVPAILMFVHGYDADLDFAPDHKTIGRALLKAAGPGAPIVSVGIAPQQLLFYSQGRVRMVAADGVAQRLHDQMKGVEMISYAVVERRRGSEVRARIQKAMPDAQINPVKRTGMLEAWSITRKTVAGKTRGV